MSMLKVLQNSEFISDMVFLSILKDTLAPLPI